MGQVYTARPGLTAFWISLTLSYSAPGWHDLTHLSRRLQAVQCLSLRLLPNDFNSSLGTSPLATACFRAALSLWSRLGVTAPFARMVLRR